MDKKGLKELSNKILVYRAKHNLSIDQMAEKCKISRQTLSNIDSCKQNPSRLTVQKILNVIGE